MWKINEKGILLKNICINFHHRNIPFDSPLQKLSFLISQQIFSRSSSLTSLCWTATLSWLPTSRVRMLSLHSLISCLISLISWLLYNYKYISRVHYNQNKLTFLPFLLMSFCFDFDVQKVFQISLNVTFRYFYCLEYSTNRDTVIRRWER